MLINRIKNNFPFIFSFFNDFLFYYSFYITCFTMHGFSGGELAMLLVIMNAAKMIADMPVGILADVISRRNVLILGILFRAIFCLLCLIGNSFATFAIAVAFVGFGNSCLWTHTYNYFYDYLKEQDKQNNFPRFIGLYYAISNIAIALSAFTGEYAYGFFNFTGIFIGSILSLCLAMVIILLMPNYRPKTKITTAINLKIASPLQFVALLKALIKKPRTINMLLLMILMDSMFVVFLDINTTIMNTVGMHAGSISHVVGIVAFIRIFTNYFSGRTEKFISFKRIHSWLLLLMVFSIFASCYNSTFMIFAVSAYLCIYPFFDTSIKTKIEHKLDSNTRATVMSLASLFVSICTIAFNAIIGLVAEQNSYFSAPICIFIIVSLILFFVRNITKCYRLDINIRSLLNKISE